MIVVLSLSNILHKHKPKLFKRSVIISHLPNWINTQQRDMGQ